MTRIVTVWDTQPDVRERLVGMLRTGISHERAAGLLRDLFGRTLLACAAATSPPPTTASCAPRSWARRSAGSCSAATSFGCPASPMPHGRQLVAAVGPVVQHYLTGDLGQTATTTG